jgi:hypothetical protein
MSLHVFGIRHHGPGCARSLLAALNELEPDVLVLEGPADAAEALPFAANAGMRPPVALLIYPPDEPRRAVYYPFAEFSPEWQAIRWALERDVGIHLMDLPQWHQLAVEKVEEPAESDAKGESPAAEDAAEAVPKEVEENPTWRTDPLALLAAAAGYEDHELWWEEQIERRENVTGLFQAILEAMRTVRSEIPETRDHDLLREAHMRKTIRRVLREDFGRVAVICGAWHAPVLDQEAIDGNREGCRIKDDGARLKGLPKCKTVATWIPWTNSRLAYRSGYGAGVHSPGWYAHLWHSRGQAPIRWITTAARLLREKDLDASSASVIETVRLADALAAMRSLRSPGLAELSQSILAVLCHGDHAPMQLIHRQLEIGDLLGEVPAETPLAPLAGDLTMWQQRLRLKPSSEIRTLDLDIRQESGLARSRLLHRLRLLDIGWGDLQQSGGRVSTFHEVWRIEWKPEFAVAIIEANVWGNTVEAAATAKTVHDASQSSGLPHVTELLDASILAGLDAAVEPLLSQIQSQAALASDVRHLMDALLPLARVARYGDVRGTHADQVMPILVGMFERAVVGLPAACSSLDDDAAAQMVESTSLVQQTIDTVDLPDLRDAWHDRLRSLMQSQVHGLLRGWCCRMLLDKGQLDNETLYRAARLALSPATPAAECAAWATGLLKGSGMLLLHQDDVWAVFDRWLSELSPEVFIELLPLLRRSFADFSPSERRQMGDKVKHLDASRPRSDAKSRSPDAAVLDLQRAKRALPIIAHILGVPYDGN